MSRDRIRLRGLRFYGYHGAIAAEREIGQRFIIDLEMSLDLCPAGTSDDLQHTVSYAEVYDEVRAIVEGPPCNLLEAVAERIAARVLEDHRIVEEVRVCVKKPEVPLRGILEAAEVEIVRAR
jgi:dihydroneopterin aldolase